jgi:hypothetical protein
MAYGMEQLRKAGQALADFDERYANKAAADLPARYGGQVLGGTPLKDFGFSSQEERTASAGRPYTQTENIVNNMAEAAMLSVPLTTNIGYRYGLPAAGVTLAGKAIYDLTGMLGGGEQTNGTVMPS